MKQKLIKWAKQVAQTLLVLAVVSVAVDYWRSPIVPIHAAQVPFQSIYHAEPTTLASTSSQQTLLLYFWGSWCGICKHTSPVIHRLHENGTPVLTVALRSGTADDVRAFLQQQGLTFDTVNDEHGALSQQWGVKVVPSILLIKNGKVVHSTTGLATYWGLKTRIAMADLLR
ncbi:protein disulfide oxidoreductase [Wielerella bovis]|uniref:protein disulfide oxidoreductase n=1 Tax=Wielerella bovis TaxID=2917790 RepID=UPI002018CA70|nr:protein disulfide oxidoreductase [Wielerella bovis]MCG7657693.1 protein disulfide oxidoreductase [Wielerella bovis]MCG7659914.1 protein disulfide oxidoreductase [Wielerella bovis]